MVAAIDEQAVDRPRDRETERERETREWRVSRV